MAKRKITLKEAQETGQIERFIKEHPSKADGKMFDNILGSMAKPKKKSATSAIRKKPRRNAKGRRA